MDYPFNATINYLLLFLQYHNIFNQTHVTFSIRSRKWIQMNKNLINHCIFSVWTKKLLFNFQVFKAIIVHLCKFQSIWTIILLIFSKWKIALKIVLTFRTPHGFNDLKFYHGHNCCDDDRCEWRFGNEPKIRCQKFER